MYRALYRKYRPQGFDSVVGQNSIVKTLKNSIKNGTFGHAYMFFGPRGVGKTTASKIFARAVNCLEPVDGDACGKCSNCLHSFEKECVDIIEIDAASNNGVDEIRELKNKISLVPAELKYKVYIIDEVHMLSIGAFNALLKTLEEPPEHAIFILATTDQQKVPETIISRCQCFSFKRISDDMIIERLKEVCKSENLDVEDEVLSEIAIASDGGMRDSLSSLDKLISFSDKKITVNDFAELNGMITKSELSNLCDDIFCGNLSSVLQKIDEFNSNGKNLIQIMSQIMHFLRNLAVDYYISDKKIDFNIDNTLSLVNLINEKMFDIKKSGSPKIYIEMLLIKYIKDNIISKNISQEIKSAQNSNKISDNSLVNSSKNISQEIISNQNSSQVIDNSPVVEAKNISREIKSDIHVAENTQNDVVTDDDDEFDFDSEYSDDDSYESSEFNSNISSSKFIDSSTVTNYDEVDDDSDSKKIINIDEIIKVRVNNTLAEADKQILNSEIELFKLFNDYTFDQEIGYLVCNLLDAKVRAASSNSVILSYEYESSVKQNLSEIEKITYVYKKITNSDKKLAFISDTQWEIEKNNYISSMKSGIKYKVIDEPTEVYEETKKNDIITNSAVELFGDIVEIN